MSVKIPLVGSLIKRSEKYSVPVFCKIDHDDCRSELPVIPIDWDTLENPKLGMNARTYSYFSVHECSSAGQKSVRRGLTRESQQWFMEMVWTGPTWCTNVYNRLEVIAIEDIGPADPLAILRVRRNRVPGQDVRLLTTINTLCECSKSRVNDLAAHSFDNERGSDEVPEETMQLLEQYMVQNDRMVSLRYLTRLFFSKKKLSNGKYRISHEGIWKVFYKVILDREQPAISTNGYIPENYLDAMYCIHHKEHWWGKDKNKGFLLVIHILHLYMFDMLDSIMEKTVVSMNKEIDSIFETRMDDLLDRKDQVGIPDFAIDKHTSKGRSKNRGRMHFYDEGCVLDNHNETFIEFEDQYKGMLTPED